MLLGLAENELLVTNIGGFHYLKGDLQEKLN